MIYHNQIGVPLSVTTISDLHQMEDKLLLFSGVFPVPFGKMMGYADKMMHCCILKMGIE